MITLRYHAEPVSAHDEDLLCHTIELGSRYYRRLAEIENETRAALVAHERGDPKLAALLDRISVSADDEQAKEAARTRRAEIAAAAKLFADAARADELRAYFTERGADLGRSGEARRLLADSERADELRNYCARLDIKLRYLKEASKLFADADPDRDHAGELRAYCVDHGIDPVYLDRSRAIVGQGYDAKRAARGASGLSPGAWGTYQLVEERHDKSRSTTAWPGALNTYAPLDEGACGVHVQGEGTVVTRDRLYASTWSFAQIDKEPYALGRRTRPGYDDRGRWRHGYASRSTGAADDRGRSGQVGAVRYRELRIRVDSEKRAPIWARLHVLIDREIPPGEISWVRAHRERVGIRYYWTVQIIVEPETSRTVKTPTAECVAIDLRCGRRIDGGRLLAYAIGSDGTHHRLVIPDLEVVRRPDGRTEHVGVLPGSRDKLVDLASIRDVQRNEVTAALRLHAQGLPDDHWLRVELTHAHLWRRWGRLGALYGRWRTSRYEGDADAFLALEEALRRDRHLLSWQVSGRRKLTNRVTGRVDRWISELTDRYAAIAVEDVRISDLVEPDHAGDHLAHVVARGVNALAPGRVRETAKKFAIARGRRLITVSAVNTTATCASCGDLCQVSGDDVVQCASCGSSSPVWVNAAKNILSRASGQLRGEVADPLARRGSGRVAKQRHNRKKAVG